MKLTLTNGISKNKVVVESETREEAAELFNRYFEAANDGPIKISSKKQSHKRLKTMRCRYCGKICMGGTGLSSHERACLKKQTPESLSLHLPG